MPLLQLLIVSSRSETQRAMLHIMEGLPVNPYTSPTTEQAWEVLMSHSIDVIFCDDQLPDGHYADFLRAVRSEHRMTQFIVLLSSDNWGDFLEAMRLGVTDVLRGVWRPRDVELILSRAERDIEKEALHLSASA